MNNDQAIEQEIQAAGKTAPRVTPDSIKAAIVTEHYFTASDGVLGRLYAESEDGDIGDGGAPVALSLLTFCVLVLRNGFTVMGKSACASPENFDANIGRKIARDDAISQVWPLEGYLLKEALYVQAVTGQPAPAAAHAGDSTMPAHQQRVIDEHADLDEKAKRLAAFTVTPTFQRLPDEEQVRLGAQLVAMHTYSRILAERIAAF